MVSEYKIGAISKLLGIPAETLRYYENCGILTPQKDSANGYRAYTPWDLNQLVLCRLYRSFGFSIAEVQQMMYEDDQETLYNRCVAREAELLKTINHYQAILHMLAERRQDLANLSGYVSRFREEESPELLFLQHRCGYELDLSDRVVQISRKWAQALPIVIPSVLIPQYSDEADLLPGQDLTEEYGVTRWGFAAPPVAAAALGLKLEPPVEYLPPQKSIHTVLPAGCIHTFLPTFVEQVLIPLRKQGVQVYGTVLGQPIAHVQEKGNLVRYMHIWVPIK